MEENGGYMWRLNLCPNGYCGDDLIDGAFEVMMGILRERVRDRMEGCTLEEAQEIIEELDEAQESPVLHVRHPLFGVLALTLAGRRGDPWLRMIPVSNHIVLYCTGVFGWQVPGVS